MVHDEIIAEIRRSRKAHADRFKNDMKAIVEDLREQARRSGRKVVSLEPRRTAATG